jgi:hypothetical protein
LRGKKDIAVGLTLTIPIPNELGIGMSGERPRKKYSKFWLVSREKNLIKKEVKTRLIHG